MSSMVIERIGSCNNCNLCTEKRVVIPAMMDCGFGHAMQKATANSEYRKCSIRFRFKSWDFEWPLPTQHIAAIKFLNPIAISPEDRDSFPSEFKIERQGKCEQCGFCCGWRNNKLQSTGCSHVITKGQDRGKCSIYDHLTDYCPEHGETHEWCIPPPSMPVRLWNINCGYRFIVNTPGIPINGNEVLRFYLINPDIKELKTENYIMDESTGEFV